MNIYRNVFVKQAGISKVNFAYIAVKNSVRCLAARRLMKLNIFCVLIFLFISSAVLAASEAEYKKISKTYTLHSDGSQEYRYYMELTLFTHTAMNRTYGESFILYNPEYQELKINSSYTRQKDGTVIKTPENAFVEVLPRQATDAPAYNHLKEMVVVHTGLELGATIYLDYSILSKPGYLPELDICDPICQTSPIKEYIIDVSVPENKSLSYNLGSDNMKPVIKTANGEKRLTWHIKNLAAISREPLSTGLQGDVLFFTATTYPSAKEALSVIKKQFVDKNNEAVKSLSASIIKNELTGKGKLFAVLAYVTDELSSSPLSLVETGFRIRPVEDVISSAYGTEAEKINLLAGLLDVIGIPYEVVAAFHPNIWTTNCGLSAIEEFFIRTTVEGRTYYLTPKQKKSSETAGFSGHVTYLSITHPGELPQLIIQSSAMDYMYDAFISGDSVYVKAIGTLGNLFVPYHNDYLKNYTANDKDATEVNGKEFSTYKFSINESLKEKINNYILFSLPDVSNSLSYAPYRNYNSKRSTSLLLPYLPHETFEYTIYLPQNMRLATPESVKSINNEVGNMAVSIKQEGQIVKVARVLTLYRQLITPNDYTAFRNLMVEWGDITNRQVLFEVID